jgi:hypothetical protein
MMNDVASVQRPDGGSRMDNTDIHGPFSLFMGKALFDPGHGFTLVVRSHSIELEGPSGNLALKDAAGRWGSTHFLIPLSSSGSVNRDGALNLAKLFSALTGFPFSVIEQNDKTVRIRFLP